VTIADVFDALTSNRAYREARKPETAFKILAEGVAKGWWSSAPPRRGLLSAPPTSRFNFPRRNDEVGLLGR
jgi:hypothetical protein